MKRLEERRSRLSQVFFENLLAASLMPMAPRGAVVRIDRNETESITSP